MATLFINKRSASVAREGDHLLVKNQLDASGTTSRTIPISQVDNVIIVGEPSVTFPALSTFIDKTIPCTFLSPGGYLRGMLTYTVNQYAQRRKEQYKLSDSKPATLHLSKQLLKAKCYNSLRVIQRLAKNRSESENVVKTHQYQQLKWILKNLHTSGSLCALRGLEGIAAMHYFTLLKHYISPTLNFQTRTRRPPKDPVNTLLSWGYTLLLTEVSIAIHTHGLDISMGVLHQNNNHSPALALDLIEPFRAIIDSLTLNLLNHRILSPDQHFTKNNKTDALYLNTTGRKIFFEQYERQIQRTFISPATKHTTTLRQSIRDQVLTFLRYLPISASEEMPIHPFFHLP